MFRHFDELVGSGRDLRPDADKAVMAALRAGDAAQLGMALSNDLQGPAIDLAPDLAETIGAAANAGALGVVVSGSGPTVAALGRSHHHALAIAAAMTVAGVCESAVCASGPVPGARVIS